MADQRVAAAKKVLSTGHVEAESLRRDITKPRSTATRAAYKRKATAADEALEILSRRPRRS